MGEVWCVDEDWYEGDASSFDAWTSIVHMLAVTILGDPRSQQNLAESCKHLLSRPIQSVDMACVFLWDALAAVSVCPEETFLKRRKLRRLVRFRLRTIKEFAVYSRQFCNGKVALLEAELAALSENNDGAILLYDSAIALSASANVLLDEAIATERAARFLKRTGRHDESFAYLNKAIAAYDRYGALAKTEKLSREVLLLLSKTENGDTSD